jgi:hypothetical protein
MIAAAGKLGMEIVKKLKFGKSYIGKKSKEGVTYLGNKGHKKSARFLDATMTKGNQGINYGAAMAKKYPKSAAALGGAAAWDLMSDDD